MTLLSGKSLGLKVQANELVQQIMNVMLLHGYRVCWGGPSRVTSAIKGFLPIATEREFEEIYED